MIVIWIGAMCAVVGVVWLLTMHGLGRLDLTDVVMEPDGEGKRRASVRKIGECVALGSTTFVLIYAAFEDRAANEWLYGLYLTAWVSRSLLGMIAQAKAGMMSASVPK